MKIRNVRVEGDRATIADRDILADEGQLPVDDDPDPVLLERIEGKWKITQPG